MLYLKIFLLYHNVHFAWPRWYLPVSAGVRLLGDRDVGWRPLCVCDQVPRIIGVNWEGIASQTWPAPRSAAARAPRSTAPTRNSPRSRITSPSTLPNCESRVIPYMSVPQIVCFDFILDLLFLHPLLCCFLSSSRNTFSLIPGVWTTMNLLCSRRRGSSKSCLSWGRCEWDVVILAGITHHMLLSGSLSKVKKQTIILHWTCNELFSMYTLTLPFSSSVYSIGKTRLITCIEICKLGTPS